MGLLDGPLAAVFGAAFSAVFTDGVLHKATGADLGTGGFSDTLVDHPVKLCVDTLSDNDRAASGLPVSAVRLTVLRAGLPVTIDLDDGLTVGTATYRVVGVDTDPAGAAFAVSAVPA